MEREHFEPEEIELLDCPEIIDRETKRRCNAPAEVLGRYALRSTDGPLEHVQTVCMNGHPLNGPASMFGEGITEPENEKPDRQEDVA